MLQPSALHLKRSDSRYKLIDGQWNKICSGPSHDAPTYLPATEKYYYFHKTGERTGKPLGRCRLCSNWARIKDPYPGRLTGYVPVSSVRSFYFEAANRIGLMELSRRAGVTPAHIQKVLNDKNKQFVSKRTLRKIMLELVSIQRKNEHSISKQARWRAEKRLMRPHDICAGCGTPTQNFTEDCKSCQERKRGQERWQDPEQKNRQRARRLRKRRENADRDMRK